MALEDVMKEILAQAQRESERIVEEGKKEAEAITGEAKRASKKRQEEFGRETETLADELKKVHASNMNLKANKMLLEAKKELMEELFARLVERLKKADRKSREKVIGRLLEKAMKEVDAAFVYSNEDDRELLPKRLKFGGAMGIIGGVVVEDKNREVRADYTFETVLQKLKEMYLGDVAKRLF